MGVSPTNSYYSTVLLHRAKKESGMVLDITTYVESVPERESLYRMYHSNKWGPSEVRLYGIVVFMKATVAAIR